MPLTILALAFLLFILTLAIFGQRLLSQKSESVKNADTEKCSICRNSFDKRQLVERQIGDIKVMYFCSTCIGSLSREILTKSKTPIHS